MNSHAHDNVRRLLAEAFEVFPAVVLGAGDEIVSPTADPDDGWTVQNDFPGKTWHNLIYYHYRHDWAMLFRWVLTDEAYVDVLPSYLCGSLIWPQIEAVTIAADLLMPIDEKLVSDAKGRRFSRLFATLSSKQRAVLSGFLSYKLSNEVDSFELYFSRGAADIHAAIVEYWGVPTIEDTGPGTEHQA